MISIDTNVLVRFLVQDDEDQGRRAVEALARLSADDPGYVTTVVLVETYWVLTRGYRLAKTDVLAALDDLADSESIVVQDGEHAARAFALAADGADFPDALIAAASRARGCTQTLSFDRHAAAALGFTAP